MKSKDLGDAGEACACDFLKANGFQIISQNMRYVDSELDIIARKKKDLHFIEVRSKQHAYFGLPEETIDTRKKKRIIRASQRFLMGSDGRFDDMQCHFDVIAVLFDQTKPRISYYGDAFIIE